MTHITGDHFKIEVEVPKGKLEKFMLATVGPWHIEVKEYVENGEDTSAKTTARGKTKANGRRGNPASKLTMTGKKPQVSDGLLAQGLAIFEKMEVDRGVGVITVKAFRSQLEHEGRKHALQTRLLHEGYLDYLG